MVEAAMVWPLVIGICAGFITLSVSRVQAVIKSTGNHMTAIEKAEKDDILDAEDMLRGKWVLKKK